MSKILILILTTEIEIMINIKEFFFKIQGFTP